MKNLFLILLSLLSLSSAFAQETTDEAQLQPFVLNEEVTIKSGDTKIIPLPRYTYIDRMIFDVKTSLFCDDSSFVVSLDGYASQTVSVAGKLDGYRSKIVVANVNARNVEIFNNSNCKIKIKGLQVLPRRWMTGSTGPRGTYAPISQAGGQVSFLLEAILFLDPLVNDADRVQYISQAKKVLGKALAVLNSSPETSQASLAAIKEVLRFMDQAEPFFDRLSSIEATFDTVQEIQSVKTSLERMTR